MAAKQITKEQQVELDKYKVYGMTLLQVMFVVTLIGVAITVAYQYL